jgi:hypothetical protein
MPKEKSNPSFWKTLPGVLTALTSFIATVIGLIVAIQQLRPPKSDPVTPATNAPPQAYLVTGRVYNQDNDTGLPGVGIAYIPAVPPNAKAIDLVTADITGVFNFDSGEIKPEQFPIHLQMTYHWLNNSRSILWDQTISFISDKTPLNLYMSLHDITNRVRVTVKAPHLNMLLLTNSMNRLRVPLVEHR